MIVKQKKHLTKKDIGQKQKLKMIVKQKKHLTLCLLPPKPRASPLLIVIKINNKIINYQLIINMINMIL